MSTSTRKAVTYVATIDHLVRLTNSVNGNPRYRIHWTDGRTAVTSPNAGINVGIENSEYRNVPLEVTATPTGLVYGLDPVK